MSANNDSADCNDRPFRLTGKDGPHDGRHQHGGDNDNLSDANNRVSQRWGV